MHNTCVTVQKAKQSQLKKNLTQPHKLLTRLRIADTSQLNLRLCYFD